jgi:hypothetical protein
MRTRFLFIALLLSVTHHASCTEYPKQEEFIDVPLSGSPDSKFPVECTWIKFKKSNNQMEQIASKLGVNLETEPQTPLPNSSLKSFFRSIIEDYFVLSCKENTKTVVIFSNIKNLGPSIITFHNHKGTVSSKLSQFKRIEDFYLLDESGKLICPNCS